MFGESVYGSEPCADSQPEIYATEAVQNISLLVESQEWNFNYHSNPPANESILTISLAD